MKKIEIIIVTAWQKKSWWLWLLMPLMLLYCFISSLHKLMYRLGVKKAYQAKIPVMVVGNITVGGSGKTPFLIALVQYLQQKNIHVAVISRGYGSHEKFSRLVTANCKPRDVGDEPCLIQQETGVIVCVGSNRAHSIELIQEQHPTTQLILCDDGLQHYKLYNDFAWIVYDVKRGLGNNMLLPVGFLREWSSRIRQPKINEAVVYHAIPEDIVDAKNPMSFHLQPSNFYHILCSQHKDLSQLTPKKYPKIHAVTGIGYPIRFFDTLSDMGYDVVQHAFPDHYHFSCDDMQFDDNLLICVTSKDAIKIKNLPEHVLQKIWVLPVTAIVSQSCYNLVDKQLTKLGFLK